MCCRWCRAGLHFYRVSRVLGSFPHGAREFDDLEADGAIAFMADDATVAVGHWVVIRVDAGGECLGEVDRSDFALELVVRFGDRDAILDLFPVDDPAFPWDWLIPPRHSWCSL